MKPFQRAVIPESEHTAQAAALLEKWRGGDKLVRGSFKASTEAEAEVEIAAWTRRESSHAVYLNDVYQVQLRRCVSDGKPDLIWLSIKRIDRGVIHDWRELQEIKNLLVGPECEGIELYPAESRRVDTSNQYHLWVVDDPAFRFSFGFNDGRHCTEEPLGKSKQRPFNT